MEVEQECVGQLADVAESLLGAGARQARLARLPRRADDAGDEYRERRGNRGHDGAIASHELGGAVTPRVLPRDHWQSREVPTHVLGELIDRGIPARRLLAQRLEDDVVEIAGKLTAQPVDVDRQAAVPLRSRRGVVVVRALRDGIAGRLRLDGGDCRAWTHRLRFADDADDVGRRPAGEAIGQSAGEQLVEQHAERVDIRGRGHRVAAYLLGAGVLRRHQLQPGSGRRERLARELGIQQLGDAEVQQLGCAIGDDEHVGRLDVAVDDQVLVRVLNRGADVPEELQARGGVEPVRVAVVDDRLSFDVFHGEVRPAVRRAAAVEKAGDERVLEAGENLTFVPEAADDAVGVHAALEHLDRDALLERVIVADAKIHGAHAAVTDLSNQAVRAKTSLLPGIGRNTGRRVGTGVGGKLTGRKNIPAAMSIRCQARMSPPDHVSFGA